MLFYLNLEYYYRCCSRQVRCLKFINLKELQPCLQRTNNGGGKLVKMSLLSGHFNNLVFLLESGLSIIRVPYILGSLLYIVKCSKKQWFINILFILSKTPLQIGKISLKAFLKVNLRQLVELLVLFNAEFKFFLQ